MEIMAHLGNTLTRTCDQDGIITQHSSEQPPRPRVVTNSITIREAGFKSDTHSLCHNFNKKPGRHGTPLWDETGSDQDEINTPGRLNSASDIELDIDNISFDILGSSSENDEVASVEEEVCDPGNDREHSDMEESGSEFSSSYSDRWDHWDCRDFWTHEHDDEHESSVSTFNNIIYA